MAHVITPILPHPELASPLAKHDIAALNELSDASQIRAWARRKVARYKKYITALLAIHNSIAPIHKLPTEILQKVFSYVPVESEWCSASWVVSLQSVCRRWRSVLLATPQYWLRGFYAILKPYQLDSVVYDSDEDEDDDDESEDSRKYSKIRDLFLARSAPCPLELWMMDTSSTPSLGWKLFEDHFDRVTVFGIEVEDEDDLHDVLYSMTTSMKRLERLELDIAYDSDLYPGKGLTLAQWQAEDFPRLTELKITAPLFCRATTVPSLQSITLWAHRGITSLPGLLDALEGCPALATIYLLISDSHYYTSNEASRSAVQNLDRVVNLPNLRVLELCANLSDTSCFLSYLSFPSTTKLDAHIDGNIGDQFALPCIFPRRLSGLHTAPTIDRLYLHSEHRPSYKDPLKPKLSVMGHIQGAERLKVSPVCRLRNAADFFHFLDAFSACTVSELALDLGPLPSDMDGDFWKQFFASLPDVRRLELLSRTTQSRATKRMIAEQFLSSVQILQGAGHGCSLAWVLRVEGSDASHMEEELHDIEQVLLNHASLDEHLERLELYVTTSGPEDNYWAKLSGVAQIVTDREGSRSVTRSYISRLSAAVDVVTVGGGWGFAEDDELNVDEFKDGDDSEDEDKRDGEESDSNDMQVV